MSLFAALGVGVSGLSAQSAAIGNVSDNLANSQTVGYKGVSTKFQSMVTQSNENVNDPGGVLSSPYYTNSVQGSLTDDSNATSLAISGSGYFAVRQAIINADGTTSFSNGSYYTRAGDFSLNENGYLVNGPGYYLSGYAVDDNGNVDTSMADPIKISELLDNPVSTSTVSYAANLPSGVTAGTYTSSSSTIQIYDSLGSQHDMSLTWEKDSTNNWTTTIFIAGGDPSGSGADYTFTVPFIFNDGSAGTAGTMESITDGTEYDVLAGSTAGITIPLSFLGAGDQTVTVDFGTYGKSTGVTQFADSSGSVSVSSFDQNGIARGSFQDLSIDENGYVSLNYDNGQSRIISQIPIVQFFAEDKLQRMSGGIYSQTLSSGIARYSVAGQNGAGTIVCNALEGSNVDIATEFTKLIQAQRVYSANAKTITTVDNMLQEVINVIR